LSGFFARSQFMTIQFSRRWRYSEYRTSAFISRHCTLHLRPSFWFVRGRGGAGNQPARGPGMAAPRMMRLNLRMSAMWSWRISQLEPSSAATSFTYRHSFYRECLIGREGYGGRFGGHRLCYAYVGSRMCDQELRSKVAELDGPTCCFA
jgi:hypothetical protein